MTEGVGPFVLDAARTILNLSTRKIAIVVLFHGRSLSENVDRALWRERRRIMHRPDGGANTVEGSKRGELSVWLTAVVVASSLFF